MIPRGRACVPLSSHEKAGGGVVVCDNLIGGESTPPASGKYLDVISPSDGTVLGRYADLARREVTLKSQ